MPGGDLGVNACVLCLLGGRPEELLLTTSEFPRQNWAPAVHRVKQLVKYLPSVNEPFFQFPTRQPVSLGISPQVDHWPSSPLLVSGFALEAWVTPLLPAQLFAPAPILLDTMPPSLCLQGLIPSGVCSKPTRQKLVLLLPGP